MQAHEASRLRRDHWNRVASGRPRRASVAYHRRLAEIYRFLIPPGQRVLELGVGTGDLLAAVEPAHGVGADFSPVAIAQARDQHPGLTLVEMDAAALDPDAPELAGGFDAIILSDLINDLWDVQEVFERLARLAGPQTRLVINFYSRLWQAPLAVARRAGLATPLQQQSWLTVPDVRHLLRLADFEPLRSWPEILCPLPLPLVARWLNRWVVKLWPFHILGLTNFVIARPVPAAGGVDGVEPVPEPRVSVIVPARNEAGNIEAIFERTPEMGAGTELVFVEGHSRDATWETLERAVAAHPERRTRLLRQTGRGKGDAVRLGFAEASGEVLMILDADLTVPPEDLPRFYRALVDGKADFVNGVRLVYPMESGAMRGVNFLGNKFFSLAFSWLIGQPIKDTLCGTKVLYRSDYERIAAHRAYFGDFDPFGDFDLIFGAARLQLALIDLPVRYRERTYGTTNIQRWRHGLVLLRMLLFAGVKLKFV